VKNEEKEKVQQYRRERLEPEIAAMSVQVDDDEDNPVLIVNIDDPAAKNAIKKVISWLGGLIGLGGLLEWARTIVARQTAIAAMGAATLSAAATLAVTEITRDSQASHPTTRHTITLSLGTATPVTVKPTKAPPPKNTAEAGPPPARAVPVGGPKRMERSPQPEDAITRSSTPTPTRRQSHTQAVTREPAPESTPTPKTSSPAAADEDAASADVSITVDVSPGRGEETTSRTPPAPLPNVEATVAVGGKACGVQVDLDPLLDLCVLS
jgi:hypothetical protein